MADSTIANFTAGSGALSGDRIAAARSPYGVGDDRYLTPDDIAAYTKGTVTAGENLLINGDFQINQRGFAGGAIAAAAYAWDRWGAPTGGGGASATISGYVVTLTSGALRQMIEPALFGYTSLASTAVTVSVDTPSADMTVTVGSQSGTITAGSGRRSVTLTLGVGDSANFFVTIAKMDLGSVATAWAVRPYELLLCQRYYAKSMRQITAPAEGSNYAADCVFGVGAAVDSTTAYSSYCKYPVTMRTTPSTTIYRSSLGTTAGRVQYFNGSWVDSSSAPGVPANSDSGFLVQFAGTFTTGAAIAFALGWAASAELTI